MLKNTLLALALMTLAGCGGSDSGASTSVQPEPGAGGATTDLQEGCPMGGQPPVQGPDGVPENCAVLFEGCCFAEESNACQAAGCGDSCEIMESYPGQVNRCAPSCPPGGAAPVQGPDGVPENCAVLFEGCCFADSADACAAAGCAADECRIATSYPGQLGRCE